MRPRPSKNTRVAAAVSPGLFSNMAAFSAVGPIVIKLMPSPAIPCELTFNLSEYVTLNSIPAASSHVRRLLRTAPSTSLPVIILGDCLNSEADIAIGIDLEPHLKDGSALGDSNANTSPADDKVCTTTSIKTKTAFK